MGVDVVLDVDAFLRRPGIAWRQVRLLKARRLRCLENAQRLSASYGVASQGGCAVGGAKCPDRMAEFVCAAVDLEPLIARAMEEYRSECDLVLAAIELLPGPSERTLLTLRAVRGCSWTRIAEETGLIRHSVKNMHSRAVCRLRQDAAWQARVVELLKARDQPRED